MYKYGLLYDACFIVLIACFCHIKEVNCSPKDGLSFWTRDPKFDRRAFTGAQQRQQTHRVQPSRKKIDKNQEEAHIAIDIYFRDLMKRSYNASFTTRIRGLKNRKNAKYRRVNDDLQREEAPTYGRRLLKEYQSSKHKRKRKDKMLSLFNHDSEIRNRTFEFPKLKKVSEVKKEYGGLGPSRRMPVQLAHGHHGDEKDDEETGDGHDKEKGEGHDKEKGEGHDKEKGAGHDKEKGEGHDKKGDGHDEEKKKDHKPEPTTTADATTVAGTTEDPIKTMALKPYSLQNILEEHYIPSFDDVNITLEVLGRTVEYNNIIILRATMSDSSKYFRSEKSKFTDEAPEKKIVFIVHGLSVMGFADVPCLYTLGKFSTLTSYYFKHLDKFDIFLMPLANPDGVARVAAENIWNKNMSPQSACPGVALDRNFDVAWNDSHIVSTCNQQFPGANPFSEVETQSVRDIFHKYSHKIIAYIHVHGGTYHTDHYKGDAVLYPKGYTDSQSDDDKYIDLRGEIDEALKNASFKVMSVNVDTLYSWYGKVTGSSVDYAATIYGIPYAMELVMQPYTTTNNVREYVLTEVWRRVIDVIFENMHKGLVKSADADV